jgi:hypothetical protein
VSYCPNCGTEYAEGANFCGNCGRAVSENAPSIPPEPGRIQIPSQPVPTPPMSAWERFSKEWWARTIPKPPASENVKLGSGKNGNASNKRPIQACGAE